MELTRNTSNEKSKVTSPHPVPDKTVFGLVMAKFTKYLRALLKGGGYYNMSLIMTVQWVNNDHELT